MTRFLLMLSPDTESGGYTVTVPGLPGCITHGETLDDAIASGREAIEVYLHGEDAESLAAAGASSDYLLTNVDVDADIPAF